MKQLKNKILLAIVLMIMVMLLGTIGYQIIAAGQASWVNCAYMTLITIASVGYSEVIDMSNNPAGRIFTMVLILAGIGGYFYFTATLTALLLEGNLLKTFRRQKMIKSINKLTQHYILCGAGETGIHILREFLETKRPLVVIESDANRIEVLQREITNDHFYWLEGDATTDEILLLAGIERAAGLMSCVSDDKENLLITLYARQLNENLRIVARCKDSKMFEKLKKSGADAVISPNLIGGMRMASEMVRPAVVNFLDIMLRDKDNNLRIEEISVPVSSQANGKKLGELDFWSNADLFPIAIQDKAGKWIYNPTPNTILEAGSAIVIIGNSEQKQKVEFILA